MATVAARLKAELEREFPSSYAIKDFGNGHITLVLRANAEVKILDLAPNFVTPDAAHVASGYFTACAKEFGREPGWPCTLWPVADVFPLQPCVAMGGVAVPCPARLEAYLTAVNQREYVDDPGVRNQRCHGCSPCLLWPGDGGVTHGDAPNKRSTATVGGRAATMQRLASCGAGSLSGLVPFLATDAGNASRYASCSAHACPAPRSPTHKWKHLVKVVGLLTALRCPYNLHGGTVLNFVRDCALEDADLDFAVPLGWWRAAGNAAALDAAFHGAGYRPFYGSESPFGIKGQFGYEQPWKTPEGMKIDLFSTVRDESRARYVHSMWNEGKLFSCSGFSDGVAEFRWGGLAVRAPVPLERALVGWYGKGWRKPYPGEWHWFHSAFNPGSCEFNPDHPSALPAYMTAPPRAPPAASPVI